MQTLVVSAPDTLQVIGDAALRAVAQDYVQRQFEGQLEQRPEQKHALKELFSVQIGFCQKLRILPVNSPQAPPLRQLSPVFSDRLIKITGLVTRKTQPTP